MAKWVTAAEIAKRYLVGETRLREYCQRGNLPIWRRGDECVLYDEEVVGKLFRLRTGDQRSLAVLGISRLGTKIE
jgi:hypothetical protein